MNLSNKSILNIKRADYCSFINGISKIEAMIFRQNIDLAKKQNIIKHKTCYRITNWVKNF